MTSLRVSLFAVVTLAVSLSAAPAKRPLSPDDIAAIATLLKLEDTREFDAATLGRLLESKHPEVRRRTVLTIGRIVDPRGRALLASARHDADVDVAATVAFATGQLKDADAVSWLGEVLTNPATPPAVAREAACALGKIRTPDARTALAHYLATAPSSSTAAPVVGEALLAIGRFTSKEDLAPILRWTTTRDAEVRWRATWALFRPKDPAAIPDLMRLAADTSGDVRFWAVRGLAPTVVDASTVPRDRAAAVLRGAVKDRDRRVRTEAIRALVFYDDDASFNVVLQALDSTDMWIAVSAAEQMGRFTSHTDAVVPKLVSATGAARPVSLRITALAPLAKLSPNDAIDAAASLMHSAIPYARTVAAQTLRGLGAPGRARLDALAADPATKDLVPAAGPGRGGSRPARPTRTDADYRRLVETWIVPDYNGKAKPRAEWNTPRGRIELELYPGDAPFGVDYFMKMVQSGAIIGTAFTRVVPNFVAQQQTIADDAPLRDEVNRRGLTRGNLSWASAGLDTGRPGYTLGSTPQPHNEGDFTALGRVVHGMDVVDRLELGDQITAARIKR